MTDANTETDAAEAKAAFDLINKEIDRLFARLRDKKVCPCCVGSGLMHRGAILLQDFDGSDAVVRTCGDILDCLDDDEGSDDATQH